MFRYTFAKIRMTCLWQFTSEIEAYGCVRLPFRRLSPAALLNVIRRLPSSRGAELQTRWDILEP
jgi:hypothetical protein